MGREQAPDNNSAQKKNDHQGGQHAVPSFQRRGERGLDASVRQGRGFAIRPEIPAHGRIPVAGLRCLNVTPAP